MLSDLPLSGATWADILKDTPMANQPLQAVTFYDMATYATPDTGGGRQDAVGAADVAAAEQGPVRDEPLA